MTTIKVKSRIQQLFCRHSYVEAVKGSSFLMLQGRRIYIMCEKCGKVKSSYFQTER